MQVGFSGEQLDDCTILNAICQSLLNILVSTTEDMSRYVEILRPFSQKGRGPS